MMKKVITVVFAAFFAAGAFSAAFDYVDTITDANGRQVKVRCVGNDSYVSYQTLDGRALARDPRGELQYIAATDASKTKLTGVSAALPPPSNAVYGAGVRIEREGTCGRLQQMESDQRSAWERRKASTRAARSGMFGAPPSPMTGTQVGFTTLADFPYAKDTSKTVRQIYNASVTKEYVDNALNSLTWTRKTGTATETSMRKYYLDQSQNLFDYSNVVTDWILLDGTKIEYDYPYDYDNSKDVSLDYVFKKTTDTTILAEFVKRFPDQPCGFVYAYDSDIRERPRTLKSKYNTWSHSDSGTYSIVESSLSPTGYFGVYDPYSNAYCYNNSYASGFYAGWITYDCGVCAHILLDELFGKIATKSYDLTGLTRIVRNDIDLGYNCPAYSDGYAASPKVSKTRVTECSKLNTIKNFNVIYAGNCAYSWSEGLWPHAWYITDPEMTFKLKYTCSDSIGAQTIKVKTYTASETTTFFPTYGATSKSYTIASNEAVPCKYEMTSVISQGKDVILDVSTLCHENGHMACDFPDLYAYDGQGEGVGSYSLMAANTKIPQNIDPYLRMNIGWLTPTELPKDGQKHTYTITTDKSSVFKFTNPSNSKEYFLIENRQQKGSDAFLPSHGLIIWRCNEDGSNTYSSRTYTKGAYLEGFATGVYRRDYEASVEQADGLYHLEQGSNRGDIYDGWYAGNTKMPSEFNDDSKPTARWKDASASGLRIFDISASGDTMTFSYQYGDSPTPPTTTHTVTFMVGSTVYNTQTVADGSPATAPSTPTYLNCEAMQYKTFKSWDKDFSAITSDLTVNAVTSGNTISHTVTDNVYQYDGQSHTFTVNVTLNNGGTHTVQYSTDGTTWSGTQPSYKDVGSYTTKYKIAAANYQTVESQGVLTITAGPTTQYTVTFKVDDFVYDTQQVLSGEDAVRPADPTYLNCQNMQYRTFKSWQGDYTHVTENKTITAVCSANEITCQATDTTATYDGQPHKFTLNVSLNNGGTAAVSYSEDNVTWRDNQPTYTDIGTYRTYYRVSADNYQTVQSSAVLTISDAPVVKRDISKATATVNGGKIFKYTGSEITPKVTVVYP